MKTPQKQTVRIGNLRRFPKFSIPPEMLVLHEVKLLDVAERLGSLCRLQGRIPQRQRA